MKINKNFLLREVAGSNIVVPVGEAQMTLNGVMTLNDVGTFIWKILENGAEKDEIVEKVLEEYDIDRETAEADIEKYLNKLRGKGILEE